MHYASLHFFTKGLHKKIPATWALVSSMRLKSISDNLFIARYVVKKLATEDLLLFANEKLAGGVFTESLLDILDEERKDWDSIAPLFEKVVKDLGYSIPSFEDAIWFIVTYHVSKISSGRSSAAKQFFIMLDNIERFDLSKDIKEYVGDNIGISGMYGWYLDDVSTAEEIESGIYQESKIWMAKHAKQH